MLTEYALQTIYGSSFLNNSILCQNSNLHNRLEILDNYGYQRGTVDHLGRLIDTVGNPTGFQLNNGKIIDSLGSSYGYVNHRDRLQNNLGQDSGLTIRNSNIKYENSSEQILPYLNSQHDYKRETYQDGSQNGCKSCGQTIGHAIWCRK